MKCRVPSASRDRCLHSFPLRLERGESHGEVSNPIYSPATTACIPSLSASNGERARVRCRIPFIPAATAPDLPETGSYLSETVTYIQEIAIDMTEITTDRPEIGADRTEITADIAEIGPDN